MTNQPDVIVVGAGVMGCGTAYWLSKAGYTTLVLEQEAIACGASGMAAAMLEAVGHGAQLSVHDPLTAFTRAGFRLHQELQPVLLEESGVDTGYRENPVIHPAFTPAEAETLQAYALERCHETPAVQWLEGRALWNVEPHVNREVRCVACSHALLTASLSLAQCPDGQGSIWWQATFAAACSSVPSVHVVLPTWLSMEGARCPWTLLLLPALPLALHESL